MLQFPEPAGAAIGVRPGGRRYSTLRIRPLPSIQVERPPLGDNLAVAIGHALKRLSVHQDQPVRVGAAGSDGGSAGTLGGGSGRFRGGRGTPAEQRRGLLGGRRERLAGT